MKTELKTGLKTEKMFINATNTASETAAVGPGSNDGVVSLEIQLNFALLGPLERRFTALDQVFTKRQSNRLPLLLLLLLFCF